ncbi:hypothetical protein [Lentzea sp. NPDC060358]|uniref:hypothetical protein n=1 Tax=Lentzea sp. NPDC060358 TaxID=3347103 RepID=UPI003657DF82
MGKEPPGGGPVAGMSSALERWARRAELGRMDDDHDEEASEEDFSPRAEHE